MTRDEWIEECNAPMVRNDERALSGLQYDRTCRLIDSRIEAALKRHAEAVAASPAPVEAGPVVELREGQVWTKDRYAKDDECIALWFYDGGQCRAFHADARESRAVTTRARFEQDIPIDRVAPILRRFGFTVRDETSPPGTSSPAPATLMPDDATLRAAGWVKCPSREAIATTLRDAMFAAQPDAILALLKSAK